MKRPYAHALLETAKRTLQISYFMALFIIKEDKLGVFDPIHLLNIVKFETKLISVQGEMAGCVRHTTGDMGDMS